MIIDNLSFRIILRISYNQLNMGYPKMEKGIKSKATLHKYGQTNKRLFRYHNIHTVQTDSSRTVDAFSTVDSVVGLV